MGSAQVGEGLSLDFPNLVLHNGNAFSSRQLPPHGELGELTPALALQQCPARLARIQLARVDWREHGFEAQILH